MNTLLRLNFGICMFCACLAAHLAPTKAGLSRYDGHTWKTFTTKSGLAHNSTWSIYQDRDGHLWVDSDGGGASRYGGHT